MMKLVSWNDLLASLRGEKKTCTVLFLDCIFFVSYSEKEETGISFRLPFSLCLSLFRCSYYSVSSVHPALKPRAINLLIKMTECVLFLPFSQVLHLCFYCVIKKKILFLFCEYVNEKQYGGIIVQWCILRLQCLSRLVIRNLPCTAYSFCKEPLLEVKKKQKNKNHTAPWIQCTFLRMIPYMCCTCRADSFFSTLAHILPRTAFRTRQLFTWWYVIHWSLHHSWLIKYWYLKRACVSRNLPLTFITCELKA